MRWGLSDRGDLIESLERRNMLSWGAYPDTPEGLTDYYAPNRHLFPGRELWFVQFDRALTTDVNGYDVLVQRAAVATGVDLQMEDVSDADPHRVAITTPVGLESEVVREALSTIEQTRWFTQGRRDGTHEHFETVGAYARMVESETGQLSWVQAGSFIVGFSEDNLHLDTTETGKRSSALQTWLDAHPQVSIDRFLGTYSAAGLNMDAAISVEAAAAILSDMPGFEHVELNGFFYTADVRPGIVWTPTPPSSRRMDPGVERDARPGSESPPAIVVKPIDSISVLPAVSLSPSGSLLSNRTLGAGSSQSSSHQSFSQSIIDVARSEVFSNEEDSILA